MSVVISLAGCCTGVKELISSPRGRTMIPPGCCPVVRRTPAHPWTIRSISQFRLCYATLFVIIFHITERCLIRQCTDGSRTEGLSFTEDNLRIFVGLTLILAGEVQVDIRLLVSLESQEGLKRNIKPIFFQRLRRRPGMSLSGMSQPARAGICFHFLGIKIAIMALRHSNNEDLTD